MVDEAKPNTTPEFHVLGLKKFLRVLNKLPKELNNEVRDASQAIANDLADHAKQAAHTPQAQLAASVLKAKRDRIPKVVVPRTKVRGNARATDIFYGAEFGGQRRPTTMQFPPHMGRRGYFLYPTARARGKHYFDMWSDAVDKAFKEWNDHNPTEND